MELKAERVKQLNCGGCGAPIDASGVKSLSTTECPKCGAKVLVPASFGHLLLTGVIGRGAAGVVCKALDNHLHRQVAVKILSSSLTDHGLVEACKREARAIARLNHPNVVQVHEIGQFKDQPFIVMELLDGGSAKDMLTREVGQVEAMDLALQVAQGLRAAQEVGVIHLDVKPANILFSRHRIAKLIDFGAALLAHQAGHDLGTPYYVAPEIALKQKPDHRADIYSLGATMFHILASAPPFQGSDVKSVIKARLVAPPPNLQESRPDVHPLVAHVVSRMLERDPEMRYADYDELIEDLTQARQAAERQASGVSPEPRRASAPRGKRRSLPPAKKKRNLAKLIPVIILAVVLIAAGAWLIIQRLNVGVVRGSHHDTPTEAVK